MQIQQRLSETQSFSGLLPLAEHAEAKLSFWESRYLCVAGYEGTLGIDALASKTLELLHQANYEFSEEEREVGVRLARRIDVLYNDINIQIANYSCCKKTIFFFINVVSSLFYGIIGHPDIRSKWYGIGLYANHDLGQYSNDDFSFYTQAQLQARFNISPAEASRRGFFSYEIGGIRRWREPLTGPSFFGTTFAV
jgi:hypothetical protein